MGTCLCWLFLPILGSFVNSLLVLLLLVNIMREYRLRRHGYPGCIPYISVERTTSQRCGASFKLFDSFSSKFERLNLFKLV